MFLAWGILLPGGILAARYLKHVKGDGWYQLHVYLQYSGLAIVLLGFLFAVAELQGLHFDSLHVKFGMAAILLACVQPVNAYMRPKKSANGEEVSLKKACLGVRSFYYRKICHYCWVCCSCYRNEAFRREIWW